MALRQSDELIARRGDSNAGDDGHSHEDAHWYQQALEPWIWPPCDYEKSLPRHVYGRPGCRSQENKIARQRSFVYSSSCRRLRLARPNANWRSFNPCSTWSCSSLFPHGANAIIATTQRDRRHHLRPRLLLVPNLVVR